jgi:hypothetical protein
MTTWQVMAQREKLERDKMLLNAPYDEKTREVLFPLFKTFDGRKIANGQIELRFEPFSDPCEPDLACLRVERFSGNPLHFHSVPDWLRPGTAEKHNRLFTARFLQSGKWQLNASLNHAPFTREYETAEDLVAEIKRRLAGL